jgi:hypothetical protein
MDCWFHPTLPFMSTRNICIHQCRRSPLLRSSGLNLQGRDPTLVWLVLWSTHELTRTDRLTGLIISTVNDCSSYPITSSRPLSSDKRPGITFSSNNCERNLQISKPLSNLAINKTEVSRETFGLMRNRKMILSLVLSLGNSKLLIYMRVFKGQPN